VTLTSVKDDAPQTLVNVPTLIFALIVAATVFLRVMKHWELFNQASKTSAVALLACLALFPLTTMWREKAGQKVDPRTFVIAAYILVLLTLSMCHF
jgi:uncharacterized membrane protein